MEWRILIPVISWEQSCIPLTYSQKSMSLLSNIEVVRWIKASSVFRLNGRSWIVDMNLWNYDMAQYISDLTGVKFESSFSSATNFWSLINSSETVPQLKASLWSRIDDNIWKVGA